MHHVPFDGKSQYDEDIDPNYRPSACGPVTAYTILRYLNEHGDLDVNELYRKLGGTRIGLFKWRLLRNLRKLLGNAWEVESCTIEELKTELQHGRPVAAKFDKWFTFHWLGTYEFDYHWVPVVGYEQSEGDIFLLIHDNGGRHRESRLRKVSYQANRSILSFVKIRKTAA
ncbi:C39 family peptidase [Sporosarcina cyprini]|uniref:C39 family peptidase n=1 Tax=Sporosarcina cyprini TaxID=2910523 RepID=UPI001EE07F80|nr:C39 family peptidase [Sporosarcina cyprini]MCG3088550.1 C39 family peptidase [Sporosarcina cyprini]